MKEINCSQLSWCMKATSISALEPLLAPAEVLYGISCVFLVFSLYNIYLLLKYGSDD